MILELLYLRVRYNKGGYYYCCKFKLFEKLGVLAQKVERRHCKSKVTGSRPVNPELDLKG